MDLSRLETEYNKIRNLRQYKNFSEVDLKKIAFNRVLEKLTDVPSMFTDKEETSIAQNLLRKYLNDFTPESTSDLNILRSIIFLEVLNLRLQNQLNEAYNDKTKVINLKMVDVMHKNLEEVMTLKRSLQITRDSIKNDSSTIDKKISLMRSQFDLWRENNQASFEAGCPYCGQVFLLAVRTEHYDVRKHPFFKDRTLFNKRLLELFLQERLTKHDVALILECSDDYVEWLIEKNWIRTAEYKRIKS